MTFKTNGGVVSQLISSDRPFSSELRPVLAALLDTLLPASADGRLPSAAELDFIGHLERLDESYLPELEGLVCGFDPAFATQNLTQRVAEVTLFSTREPAAFGRLIQRVYDCYYQNEQVRVAIGVSAGAPFPQGNEVASGDLSLLDPVIARGDLHRYRAPR